MKAASKEPSKPVEDESLKKNTDCVYFLASPLTCKKGNECEYRHSEEARMNPRDCWFWLNGNCLNPKCAFRHPPLDGLVGTPLATSAKPSIPLSLPVASAQLPVVKQGTPCYYFQKGQCLKGDRCAFMHGSQPIDRVPPHPSASKTTSGIEPQTLKKPQWSLEKCNQQKNVPRQNVIKPIGLQTSLRPPMKNVAAPFTNGIVAEKNMPPISLNSDTLGYKVANAPSIISGNFASRTQYGPQSHALYDRNFRNKKEPGEFLGKTSPGFDALVDTKLHKSDYYEEDHFGRTRGDVGRHLNTADVIDYGRSAEYSPATKFDRETYSDSQGYDTYGKAQDRYVQKPRKASSERILDRPYLSESRGYSRVESPEQIDGLDLRHRLSKQRRTNGSRSDVSPDSDGDLHRMDDRVRHVENQRYQGRDSHYLHQESSRSSRLQGRISLPGRSSPDRNRNDFHAQDRERKRSSPARASVSSFTGIPRDSIRRRVGDDINAEGRSFGTPFIRREDEEQSGDGKNSKVRKFESSQELEDPSSFEGPKPLREILKRKRQEKTVVPDDSTAYGSRESMYQKEGEGNSTTVASDKKSDNQSNMKEEVTNRDSSKEEHKFDNTNSNGTLDDEHEEEEEGVITEEAEDQPSAQRGNELKAEDTMMLDNAEDGEYETFDQKDVESDFDQVDGDFKTEEDGYQDLEEEEGDDDGDDFAKRIGVMFS